MEGTLTDITTPDLNEPGIDSNAGVLRTLQTCIDQGVIVIEGYSVLPRYPDLEAYHDMQFIVIPRREIWSKVPIQG